MKQIITFLLIFISGFLTATAQAPVIQWQKCLGGKNKDDGFSICKSGDGGYVIAGSTASDDGDITGFHGTPSQFNNTDAWIVKIDGSGNIIWQRAFGGTRHDVAHDVKQTEDGGFIVAIHSASNDGDLAGIHKGGSTEAVLLKLKPDGSVEWKQSYLIYTGQRAYAVHQTSDKGYIVGGMALVQGPEEIAWMMKTDEKGAKQWELTFPNGTGEISAVLQNADGDYIGVGEKHMGNSTGLFDVLAIKINASGKLIWEKHLGGSKSDKGYDIKQTKDGGYIIVGETESNDRDITANKGSVDVWVVKLNADGNISWQKNLGSSSMDIGHGISETTDGGYIITGEVISGNDKDVSGNRGHDMWVVKIDNTGNIQWQKCLGGSSPDRGFDILQTDDGGFIVAGITRSDNNGDVSGYHSSAIILASDYWVVKLAPDGSGISENSPNAGLKVYPNPAKDKITFESMQNIELSYISIYNSLGQQVMQAGVERETATIDISGLKTGIYIYRVYGRKAESAQGIFIKE